MQGEAGCEVQLNPRLHFRTGRADCVPTDPDRPYIAAKHEVHPNPVGDGLETVTFFQEQFGFSGQETVAILGAHTMGSLRGSISLFSYVWISRGHMFFNNDYYKMVTDETRWYFDDDQCTKIGDAYNNKPVRRWVAGYKRHTHNGGPVQWISENYVCPTCTREAVASSKCCQNVPEGLFCTPDALNMTEKTPLQLSHASTRVNCEAFRFISGADETALPSEIGLYYDFQNRGDGLPVGCPGFEDLSINLRKTWSTIDGIKSDPQCHLQTLAHPASDRPTSWYMREYAADQARFMRDFAAAFDKMLSNGYSDLTLGEDQFTGIECSEQRGGSSWGQCWEAGTVGELGSRVQYMLASKMDGRVVELMGDKVLVNSRDEGNIMQRWYLRPNGRSLQLVSAGTSQLMSVTGISDFELGAPDDDGFVAMIATGGVSWKGKLAALDRGSRAEDGRPIKIWGLHGNNNQKFKLFYMDNKI